MKIFSYLIKVDIRFRIGVCALGLCLFALVLSFFNPEDSIVWNAYPRDIKPSLHHFLGTNSMGQDIFWKLTVALRNSLLLSFISLIVSRSIALVIGLLAGYKGGWLDRLLMLFNDSFIIIPVFPLLILLTSILKSHMTIPVLAIILGALGWAWDARLFRSQIINLRERTFTYTAKFSGMKDKYIILKEHFPFLIPLVMAASLNNIIWVIGMEITLAILGLSSLDTPTIGTMIYWAHSYQAIMLGYWYWILPPIFLSIFLILGLYTFSLSIGQHLDPRTRIAQKQR